MITTKPGGIELAVRVIPRAGKTGFAGMRDGALLVRLGAAPVEGAANAELIDVLSRLLKVPRRAVAIVSGERGRLKRVRVDGISADEAEARLTQ
jgi:uncharacterized protein (TIGR00251 family)